MRVQREFAVPVLRNLDSVDAAVVLTEERFRTRKRLELRIAKLPFLGRTRHRRDARPPNCRGLASRHQSKAGSDHRADKSSYAHQTSLERRTSNAERSFR